MLNNLGNKETMSHNIQRYMDMHNMKRRDLADFLGVPYTTLCGWLSAETYPRIDKIEKMAQIFGISKSDLVEELRTSRSVRIPVLGRIPAGIPIEAIEDIIDYEEIPADWTAGGKEYFALLIQGDSMSPKYLDGDVVIFLKAVDCDNGAECAVFVNGDDATFKKVRKNMDGITLFPLNPEYDPSYYSNEDIETLPVTVVGIAKEIRRTI